MSPDSINRLRASCLKWRNTYSDKIDFDWNTSVTFVYIQERGVIAHNAQYGKCRKGTERSGGAVCVEIGLIIGRPVLSRSTTHQPLGGQGRDPERSVSCGCLGGGGQYVPHFAYPAIPSNTLGNRVMGGLRVRWRRYGGFVAVVRHLVSPLMRW